MLIVAFLLCLVKNFFVVDEAFPFFLADLQKGDNGVFIVYRILRCCKPKCNAEMFAGFTNGNFFQKHTGLRAGVPDDVIGTLDNFSQVCTEPFIVIRVALLDVLNALISDDNLIGSDIFRYDLIQFFVQLTYKIHVRVHTNPV